MSRVLLIEPNLQLSKSYRAVLERAGYTIDTCAYAEDAVHKADTNQPDLVVLEVQLPSHNGIEFLHEFRSYPEWQQIPVLLLTMTPPQRLMISPETMLTLGIARCLYKPTTTLKQLVSMVNLILLSGQLSSKVGT